MVVTGVPSLWDEDETGTGNDEGGSKKGRPARAAKGVLVTERDVTVLRWVGEVRRAGRRDSLAPRWLTPVE